MNRLTLFLLFATIIAITCAATYAVLVFLRKRALLDHPNPRSSHTVATPRGGGLAVIATLVPVRIWIGTAWSGQEAEIWTIAGGALALAAISWFDDLSAVAPQWRLLGQIGAVAAALAVMPVGGPYFAGLLPPVADLIAAGLIWVWFINLFNFMDGIDGMAGMETASIGIGVAAVAATGGIGGTLPLYGLSAAAAALGFLWWNWHPARVFLGDVGSAPLGFLLGWLLLSLSALGLWAAALILPLYYLADATITLVSRGARGEKIWQAHRQHYYQKAVRGGLSHASATLAVLLVNLCLIGLAAAAASGWRTPAVGGAVGVVFLLLCYFGSRLAENSEDAEPPVGG